MCPRWVLHLLTLEQKQKDNTLDNLRMFDDDPMEFLHRLITTDETWDHHYTPESKEQSKQRIEKGQPAPKKVKVTLSFNKVPATVF